MQFKPVLVKVQLYSTLIDKAWCVLFIIFLVAEVRGTLNLFPTTLMGSTFLSTIKNCYTPLNQWITQSNISSLSQVMFSG